MHLLRGDTQSNIFTLPGHFTKGLFVMGCIGALGIAYYVLKRPLNAIYKWYKSFGNAKERLEIVPNPRNKKQKVYAVIFGAHNNGSRAFCKYLAEFGYSLIIIDRDQALLNSAEKHIFTEFPDISLMKITMDEFDEGEMLRVVKQVNKLGDIIRGVVFTKNIMLSEQNNKKFEELTYDEVHQIMHNSEMIAGLTNVLLKPIKKAGNGFVINLRNVKYKTENEQIYWDLLYYSTSRFSSLFIEAIKKSESKISVIDVEVNYSNIKKDDDKEKLCSKTFNYLGISESITF